MPEKKEWNIVSNHGAVLLVISERPGWTMREIAASLHITERQVARIVRDLADAGIVCVTRRGRQNSYTVCEDAHFRRPALAHIRVGDYIALMRLPPGSAGPDDLPRAPVARRPSRRKERASVA